MKTLLTLCCFVALTFSVSAQGGDWIELFNGKNLDGWKISEKSQSFQVEDGVIKVAGPRGHAFYNGDVANHDFNNFEVIAEVKTMPGANSGIFIHTQYQEDGWPEVGYEIQVNQSHSDWRKTGSVYSYQDVKEVFVKDDEWYTEHIIVQGDVVTVKINGKTVNVYDQSKDEKRKDGLGTKKVDHGTIALQVNYPKLVSYYKSVNVQIMPH